MATILLVNDDGVHSDGLRALYDSLEGEHEIYVVAPDRERSAIGRAISLKKPLRLDNTISWGQEDRVFACNGTPTDCVHLALDHVLLERGCDLVLSGINRGYNLGTDVFYSGTVAAAMEASVYGVRSVALSMSSKQAGYDQYKKMADSFRPWVKKLLAHQGWPERQVLNVNFPAIQESEVRYQWCRLGKTLYPKGLHHRKDPYEKDYFWLSSEPPRGVEDEGTDHYYIKKGFASLTPIGMDLTVEGFREGLEDG